MGSVGVSASAFNIGLGSNHMSTGNHDTQYNLTGSIGATIGYGQGNELPMIIFTKKTDSGMMNSYKSSITVGQSITFNSEGNNQRVSSIGFKAGDFSLYTYNDMIGNGYIGHGKDRFDSGGGNILIFNGSGTFTFGTNVFTGDRIDAKPGQKSMFGFGLAGSNPTGGAFGTYSQSTRGQSQSSGMTYYNFKSV